ncbi:MAG TPA: GxxExxY protein [Blastocatellia bacterium]|nr:GxxExxY protein [Blastocatellia bacterium]
MPVRVRTTTCRLEEIAFGRIAYDVMRCVFDIHNEFGRFCDEKIYKRELARRFPGTELEVPIEIKFESFCKLYFLDVLINGAAVFEFKTAESLTDRHRSQLLHYLMMADLPHGKLVNTRTEQVQHEFVNTTLRPSDRTKFKITDQGWGEIGNTPILEWCVAFLRDVGTGLDINLYEEALTHLLGGDEIVLQDVEIVSGETALGLQKFRLVAPGVAFKVTALSTASNMFEIHARRLLEHTQLDAIQWINVTLNDVSFRTICR